jgi:hypothetical protein
MRALQRAKTGTLGVMDAAGLELAIIEWFRHRIKDPQLRAQLAWCSVGQREITSGGFFAELLTSTDSAPSLDVTQRAYTGCGLFAPELEIHADCILHTIEGRIRSLEVLAIGEGHPLKISTFQLREVPENNIDLRRNDA